MAITKKARPRYGGGRQALLDAVVRVAARHGLRRVTYRAVADEAGVTHGLVRHHFGSGEELLHEALVSAARQSIDTSPLEPPSGRLEDFNADLSKLVANDPDLQAFQFELVLEGRRRPALATEALEIYDTYLAATRRALEQMGIPASPAFARLVFAALDGLVMQQLIYGCADDTDDSLTELRKLLALLRDQAREATG